MPDRPTKKQKELLEFIDSFIKSSGYGPSYREIMRGLDYKSVSTVAVHVDGLITRGWLTKKDASARSLQVIYNEQTPAEQEIYQKIIELESEDGDYQAEIDILTKAIDILSSDQP